MSVCGCVCVCVVHKFLLSAKVLFLKPTVVSARICLFYFVDGLVISEGTV